MQNKMLIDASHQEETRVVVTHGNRIEEFDFESQDKKQLRGNIYLARVTRVEPSLQAAFVEYGGNRHGFLAFSEIHPDYYQIPVADRQALLRAEAEAAAAEEEDEEAEREEGGRGRRRRRGGRRDAGDEAGQAASAEDAASSDEPAETDGGEWAGAEPHAPAGESVAEIEAFEPTPPGESGSPPQGGRPFESAEDSAVSEAGEEIPPISGDLTEREDQPVEEADSEREPPQSDDSGGPHSGGGSMAAEIEADVVSEPAGEVLEAVRGTVEDVSAVTSEEVESVGAEDALEEVRSRRKTPRRHYKIQEVIKRRQILLVQVVKEERGNKGAAITTYLSLAGRYSVLMPNTARGGGISRKITNAQDRKRLKDVVKDLEVPQGMGVILRTAGENRTKAEIKRDYEYLMRLWENVRSLTLQSIAPALVYEEGSLIKRSVRDLYNKDIDEILVSGEEGYREAKDFMRMLMPSHAKVVQPYRDPTPIFAKAGIEAQLDRMLQPQVILKSGGYIVINQTEALVSIDVNSGRATREHSIEDTALQTNLEAAEEVARQLRLRDLAGLIVIDFIDMEENRNNRSVEKRLKDCLKNDRARIQVGRISHFGLLEMSRQRIRSSVLESTMKPCPHCGGTGHVRSDSSVALLVLRSIEEFLLKDSRNHITVRTPTQTAFYLLNGKRGTLTDLEARFGVTIAIEADETVGAQHYVILRGAVAEKPAVPVGEPVPAASAPFVEPEEEGVEEAEAETAEEAASSEDAADGDGDRKRRRRRRRRGGRDHAVASDAVARSEDDASVDQVEAEEGDENAEGVDTLAQSPSSEQENRKRRRGKRGGRRNRRDELEGNAAEAAPEDDAASESEAPEGIVATPAPDSGEALDTPDEPIALAGDAPPAETDAVPPASVPEFAATSNGDDSTGAKVDGGDPEPALERASRRKTGNGDAAVSEPVVSSVLAGETAEPAAGQPKKAGWWQRKGFF